MFQVLFMQKALTILFKHFDHSWLFSLRLRDNSVHLQDCSPFWVGIFINKHFDINITSTVLTYNLSISHSALALDFVTNKYQELVSIQLNALYGYHLILGPALMSDVKCCSYHLIFICVAWKRSVFKSWLWKGSIWFIIQYHLEPFCFYPTISLHTFDTLHQNFPSALCFHICRILSV